MSTFRTRYAEICANVSSWQEETHHPDETLRKISRGFEGYRLLCQNESVSSGSRCVLGASYYDPARYWFIGDSMNLCAKCPGLLGKRRERADDHPRSLVSVTLLRLDSNARERLSLRKCESEQAAYTQRMYVRRSLLVHGTYRRSRYYLLAKFEWQREQPTPSWKR